MTATTPTLPPVSNKPYEVSVDVKHSFLFVGLFFGWLVGCCWVFVCFCFGLCACVRACVRVCVCVFLSRSLVDKRTATTLMIWEKSSIMDSTLGRGRVTNIFRSSVSTFDRTRQCFPRVRVPSAQNAQYDDRWDRKRSHTQPFETRRPN